MDVMEVLPFESVLSQASTLSPLALTLALVEENRAKLAALAAAGVPVKDRPAFYVSEAASLRIQEVHGDWLLCTDRVTGQPIKWPVHLGQVVIY